MGKVRRPYERVRMNVACQSSRHGAEPLLITIHSTEGNNVPDSVRDLEGLGEFFDRLSTQASSHVAVDADGYSAKYVPDEQKAWTQAYFNPVCLSIECIGRAAQAKKLWTPEQYDKVARYIAYWSVEYDIPIGKGRVSQNGQVTKKGVIRHSELGHLGGDHHDPGSNFDLAHVNKLARQYKRKGWD